MEKKIWFITGISSGLGKAIAEKVIEKGDFVVGTFRTEAQAQQFNDANEGKAFAYTLDMNNAVGIENVVKNALERFTTIDVLVNNAGFGMAGAIEETSSEETRSIFETNFFGALQLTQSVLPVFRQQKSGHIIQVSSHGGVKAFAGFGIYNASKFALEGISEALAQELHPLGIHVTIVEPGPFRTKFAAEGFLLAAQTINDYEATAGTFRQKIKGVNGLQEGDPHKAATPIYNLTQLENPPLRLPLGKIAVVTIQSKIQSLQTDLDNGRTIAESVVY